MYSAGRERLHWEQIEKKKLKNNKKSEIVNI